MRKIGFFILLSGTPSKNMTFKKSRRSKSNLHPKLCQFLYLICDVISDRLSELRQISCIIPHQVEVQDSLHGAKFLFVHLSKVELSNDV